MKRLAILGAAGTIGQRSRQKLLERTNRPLVLYARRATERLHEIDAARETIIDGNFLDLGRLVRALQGCQSVFLTDIHDPRATLRVIEAMKLAEVNQLISVAPEERLCTSEALKQLADLTAPFLAPEKHQLLLQPKKSLNVLPIDRRLRVGCSLCSFAINGRMPVTARGMARSSRRRNACDASLLYSLKPVHL